MPSKLKILQDRHILIKFKNFLYISTVLKQYGTISYNHYLQLFLLEDMESRIPYEIHLLEMIGWFQNDTMPFINGAQLLAEEHGKLYKKSKQEIDNNSKKIENANKILKENSSKGKLICQNIE